MELSHVNNFPMLWPHSGYTLWIKVYNCRLPLCHRCGGSWGQSDIHPRKEAEQIWDADDQGGDWGGAEVSSRQRRIPSRHTNALGLLSFLHLHGLRWFTSATTTGRGSCFCLFSIVCLFSVTEDQGGKGKKWLRCCMITHTHSYVWEELSNHFGSPFGSETGVVRQESLHLQRLSFDLSPFLSQMSGQTFT